MRGNLEVQAEQERAAIADLRALATSPIRLPPVDLLTERVFQLRALTESPRRPRRPRRAPDLLQRRHHHDDPRAVRGRPGLRRSGRSSPPGLPDPKCRNALRAGAGRALSTLGCAGAIPSVGNGDFGADSGQGSLSAIVRAPGRSRRGSVALGGQEAVSRPPATRRHGRPSEKGSVVDRGSPLRMFSESGREVAHASKPSCRPSTIPRGFLGGASNQIVATGAPGISLDILQPVV
jgi:hypothetical protein